MLKTHPIRQSLAAIALISCTTLVQADSSYVGGSMGFIELSNQSVPDISFTTLSAKAGKSLNDNFSAEFRLGSGVSNESLSATGGEVTFDVENYYGVYLKAGNAVNEAIYPYFVVGYTKLKLGAETQVNGFGNTSFTASASDSESDISYGIGLDLGNKADIIFNLEYINLLNKNGTKLNSFSFGLTKHF